MTNCYRDVRKSGPFGQVRSGSGNTKGKRKRKRGRRIRQPRNQGRMEFKKRRQSQHIQSGHNKDRNVPTQDGNNFSKSNFSQF